jgi:hypothetical protein
MCSIDPVIDIQTLDGCLSTWPLFSRHAMNKLDGDLPAADGLENGGQVDINVLHELTF